MNIFFKLRLLLFGLILILFSCQKADKVQTQLIGTWERVVFNHGGAEQWIFTADNKLYVLLTLPGATSLEGTSISGDTVCVGDFTTEIVHYNHGTLLNKNIFKVPAITISGFINFKYIGNNMDFTAYNTVWQIHKVDSKVLIITTDMYNNIHGGLEQREFYKK